MSRRNVKQFSGSTWATRKGTRLRLLFHCFGLSALGSALFLQGLVLGNIITNGYFRGIEQNTAVLYSEVLLMGLAIAYCAFLVWHFLVSQLMQNAK